MPQPQLKGGQCGVESEVGVGSTFWCTVRVEKVAPRPLAAPAEPRLASRPPA